jgi:hypothetical protein
MSSARPQDRNAAAKTTTQSSIGSAAFPSIFETNGTDAATNWIPMPLITAACKYLFVRGRVRVCLDGYVRKSCPTAMK